MSYLRRNHTNELEKTWLVQRLNAPYGGQSPFAFGGGLKNGGLSDEAIGIINNIWSFDYMGAAEFEFGAVPDALRAIASQHNKLVAFSFEFDNTRIDPSWRKEDPKPEGTSTIYVICHKDWATQVQERIEGWASKRWNKDLKEATRLADVLNPSGRYPERVCGWLELNNGFMFFTNKEMWGNTADLFGVKRD